MTVAALVLLAGCETLETRETIDFYMQFRQMEADAARPAGLIGELRRLDGDRRHRCRDRDCSIRVAQQIAELLGLEENMYEFVARETALRAGAYAAARAARDRLWSDVSRATSSIYAETQGLPVNIPTVTDDFFHRGNATGVVPPAQRAPTATSTSSHCIVHMANDGFAWWRNSCLYTVRMAYCRAAECGTRGTTYYTEVRTMLPNSTIRDDGRGIQIAACRLAGDMSFHPDWWDGVGGFRCVAG